MKKMISLNCGIAKHQKMLSISPMECSGKNDGNEIPSASFNNFQAKLCPKNKNINGLAESMPTVQSRTGYIGRLDTECQKILTIRALESFTSDIEVTKWEWDILEEDGEVYVRRFDNVWHIFELFWGRYVVNKISEHQFFR